MSVAKWTLYEQALLQTPLFAESTQKAPTEPRESSEQSYAAVQTRRKKGNFATDF